MKNLIIFDGSTKNIILCGSVNGVDFFHISNFEKSSLSRQIPDFFTILKPELKFDNESEIIIGNGPGPFTGLKTANSFFLGILYSHGIKNIRLVSSFKILSALTPSDTELNKLVIIPFNRGEFFISLLDKDDNFLIKDLFIKEAYENVVDIFKNYTGLKIELVLGSDVNERLINVLSKHFDIAGTYQEKYSFNLKSVLSLLNEKTIDITKEPFILNHIINPAGIDKNCNIYVTNNFQEKLMKPESLSIEVITEKITKLKEEHARYNELSNALAAKEVFTQHDEMELNTLRKKKLIKKDMISYYENLLKNAK